SFVDVSIFDSQEKMIRCICKQLLDKGHYLFQWVTNTDLKNGIYIIALTENNHCSGLNKIVKNQ
ncbi:MAG TPA: hypothetical protein VMC08_04990, partial [Bacteroidales bacterium]|nr:hypothetical protein [Bacteroidales bacterium]